MNNEPVAWMHTTICSWVSTFIHPETQPEEWTPLYTHPVKTLTDEEITEEWAKFYPDVFHTHLINFVRAILKKASEK
jgi:hypothetical protein